MNEDLDETKDGIQIKFEDGVALVSVAPILAGEVDLDLNSQFFYVPLFEGKFELLVSQQKVNQEITGNLSTKIVEGVKVEAQDFLSLQQISADDVEPKVFSFKVTDSSDSIVDFLSPEVKSSSKKVSIQKLEDSNGVYNYQISLPKTSGIYDFEVNLMELML